MGSFLGAPILDVAIGLSFIYLLLSIFCTVVNEWLSSALSLRSTTLETAIKGLLDNQPVKQPAVVGGAPAATAPGSFVDLFYQHPVISGTKRGGVHPSFLHSSAFATALMDITTATKVGKITFEELQKGVEELPEGDVKKVLSALLADSEGDLGRARKNIETWFDDSMDSASEWYKRTIQKYTFVLAVAITLLANANTLNIVRVLWTDPTVRSALVEQAKARADMPRPTATVEYKDPNDPLKPTVVENSGNTITEQDRAALSGLVGWTEGAWTADWETWLDRLVGWFLTAIAVSLGAPFWFDGLKSLVNLRGSGRSAEESETLRRAAKANA